MILQRGSKGKKVYELQRNLKFLGTYSHAADGEFGPKTQQAVLEFQQRFFVDGIVDKHTALSIKEAVEAYKNVERTIFVNVPNGLREIESTFGIIKYEDVDGGYVKITNNWAENNIENVNLPIVGIHPIHKKLRITLETALNEIRMKGLDQKIVQFGTFCPRHKMHDKARGLSTHSWGIACDINWSTNPPGQTGDMDRDIVTTLEKYGFVWGGRWKVRDDMHFQLACGY